MVIFNVLILHIFIICLKNVVEFYMRIEDNCNDFESH